MSSEPGLGATLRRLGAALLNATLLLLALVLILAVVLVAQLRGLAQETRAASLDRVTALEARLAETQATAREALAALEALEDGPRPPPPPGAIRLTPEEGTLPADLDGVERALTGLVAELAALRIAPLDPDTLERDEEGLIRWLVLVILRTAARGILAPEG